MLRGRRRSEVPGRAGVAEIAAGEHAGAVHLPDVDLAAVVLPQNVRGAVMVEIAGPLDVPAGPGVADAPAADHSGAIQFPNIGLAAVVLPQDVGFVVIV